MFHIVLFEPRIPQNTGNIARTCAVTGSALHLIKPYAFEINDRNLKRAGLTYWRILELHEYDNFEQFLSKNEHARMFLLSSKASKPYSEVNFQDGDMLIFGREDTGVPDWIHQKMQNRQLRIPMKLHPEARCINVSTSVGIVLFEALKQNQFLGLE